MDRRTFFDNVGRYATLGLGGLEMGELTLAAAQSTPASTGVLIPKIASFIAAARYDAIPARAVETAKTAIMDCLGVAAAGAHEEPARIAGALAREESGKAEASVFGQRFRASAVQAAFVNGVAAHAHDFDHSFVVGGQPTSPIIPAVLSLGEAVGASGRQIIEAYVTGFDLAARMIFSVQKAGASGWHANGTAGAFGATAAAARLLNLGEAQIAMALGITASMASGVSANFGTMTKPLHVGMAARNGVLAARLAQSGFTSSAQSLDGRNGYYESYFRGGAPDLAVFDDLGRAFALEKYGVRFKPYPCGGLTHTAIYAAIALRNERSIAFDSVDRVDVEVSAETAATIAFRSPKTGTEGKFSMQYLIARALRDGAITLDTFTDEAVRAREVLPMLERIDMKVDPKMESGTDGSRPAAVTIRLRNGETLSRREQFPKGSPQAPMTPTELVDKFRACARRLMTAAATERALDQLGKLETLGNIRTLTRSI
jgi:2-methylcitrate dehydratase PrpD